MKNKKQDESVTSTSYSGEIWKDSRFSHLVNDPRFKELPQSTRKVKIDQRFESMFNNEKFKVKYTIDKYGRKINKTSSEDFKKYYDLDKSDDDDDDEELQKEPKKSEKSLSSDDSEEEDLKKDEFGNDLLDTVEDISGHIKLKLHDKAVDYARGHAALESESSSDEESSEEEDGTDEMFIPHVWGELDRDAPRTDDITNRIAACNMDWDRIKAVDIMILCSSFLPQGGTILSVTIYPSEFGKERMAEEDLKGPLELTEIKLDINDDGDSDDEKKINENDEEGSDYHMEKLRKYQLNRLKYYYAVIECDNENTANKIYEECDGLEYESSATKLDLRFISNDVTFDDEPKETCSVLPDLTTYKPRLFTTTALQQAKVELTWDEMNLDRKELSTKLMSGKIAEVSDAELRRYVAYSSEEEEEKEIKLKDYETEDDEENEKSSGINKYKELLMEIQQKEEEKKNKQFEIEYSWGIGTQDKIGKLVEKKKTDKKAELAPFEKIIEKKKEKKKAKKLERKKMLGKSKDKQDDGNGWSSDEMPDDVDMNDPYFAEEFENGEFEEKPKKSKKKNKKEKDDRDDPDMEQKNAELSLLMGDNDENDKVHFSLKKIQDAENLTKTKKKKKSMKKKKSEIDAEKKLYEDNFELNIDDNRFKALYTSHHFSIDPTDSHFKKTKGMETLITEKLKRRKTQSDDEQDKDHDRIKKPKKDVAVSMLVKSIKRKVGKQ